MVQYCGVPQCTSKWKAGRVENGLKFHSFPKDKTKCKEWTVKLRTNKKVTPSTKVCSLHFLESDYAVTSLGAWRILKRTAIPSQNLPKRSGERVALSDDTRSRRQQKLAEKKQLANETAVEVAEESSNEGDGTHEIIVPFAAVSSPSSSSDDDANDLVSACSVSTQTFLTNRVDQFIAFEQLNEKDLMYFSGFDSARFDCLYEFIVASEDFTKVSPLSSCTLKDQLLITLCKYKHNLEYTMLGFLFRIPPKGIQNIFSVWTALIYVSLKTVDFWKLGNKDKDKYRAIIDCTEIPVVKSENPAYHQLTYSHYKNRPTFKSLVAIDECGKIIFCSDIYGGSTSDRQITILSQFCDLLEEGTTVLADRGFEISDLLENRNIALNIPPFLRGKKQLSEEEVMLTRKIANRRIHVERLIGLSKINKIMRDPMPTFLWHLANKINYNCTMLCNFKPSIVKSMPKKYHKSFWASYVQLCTNHVTEEENSDEVLQ